LHNLQAVATRWNSTLILLKSVSKNLTELKTLADASKDRSLQIALLDIDVALLHEVINTLQPFDDATRLISADKVPTIHLVTSMPLKLLRNVESNPEDSDPVKLLKSQLMTYLTSHFRVSPLHNIALLLDPRQKNNRGLMNANERMQSITEIKAMVSVMAGPSGSYITTESSSGAGKLLTYLVFQLKLFGSQPFYFPNCTFLFLAQLYQFYMLA